MLKVLSSRLQDITLLGRLLDFREEVENTNVNLLMRNLKDEVKFII